MRYRSGGEDVKAEMVGGSFATGVLQPGEAKDMRLAVKIAERGETRLICRVTAASDGDDRKSDSVRAKVRVRE